MGQLAIDDPDDMLPHHWTVSSIQENRTRREDLPTTASDM
jgi:hypothetical protein